MKRLFNVRSVSWCLNFLYRAVVERGPRETCPHQPTEDVCSTDNNNFEGNTRTHLGTHSQCKAVKLLSCCFFSVKLQGENAKLRQELELR